MTGPMIILAVDDDHGRYDYLRVLLEERERSGKPPVLLVVATCRACVELHLRPAAAVLLDYDLDSGALCAACGGWCDVEKGSGYVDAIARRRVPVIVTSASHPDNRRSLADALVGAGVRVEVMSALDYGCEARWLGRLWAWGVL